jgi:hypothetical protein
MYYLRFAFATWPLEVLDSLRVGPYFALRALERIGTMQLVPGSGRRRSGLNSGEGSPESDQGRAGEGPRATRVRFLGLDGE